MSLAKFVPLQKFVEMSLSSYEKHLIPSKSLIIKSEQVTMERYHEIEFLYSELQSCHFCD